MFPESPCHQHRSLDVLFSSFLLEVGEAQQHLKGVKAEGGQCFFPGTGVRLRAVARAPHSGSRLLSLKTGGRYQQKAWFLLGLLLPPPSLAEVEVWVGCFAFSPLRSFLSAGDGPAPPHRQAVHNYSTPGVSLSPGGACDTAVIPSVMRQWLCFQDPPPSRGGCGVEPPVTCFFGRHSGLEQDTRPSAAIRKLQAGFRGLSLPDCECGPLRTARTHRAYWACQVQVEIQHFKEILTQFGFEKVIF